MADARDIILRPVVTEKSTALAAEGKFVFEVDRRATKTKIKQAIEEIFKVDVVAVNTLNVPGKLKRLGRYEGMTPARKKAIVTLKPGQTIPIFEGM